MDVAHIYTCKINPRTEWLPEVPCARIAQGLTAWRKTIDLTGLLPACEIRLMVCVKIFVLPNSFPLSTLSLEAQMKKVGGFSLIVALLLGFVGILRAQDAGGLPKPGPEHEKMAYFVGKWTSDGDLKPSPYGPGGKFTFTETCEWLDGKFAILCRSEGQMVGMTVKGLSVMSYDSGERNYIYFESNSMGENTFSHGTVDGDTWTWTSESKMNGQMMHSRFTLKRLTDDSASYKFEMASGSEPFAVLMEGKQSRQK